MSFDFADESKWSSYRLEEREAELRETDGPWLNATRRAVKAREMSHIMFELQIRYNEEDVLHELEKVVERGESATEPEVA
jgi:hypothetical protein